MNIKKIAVILAATIISAGTAYAAEVDYDRSTGLVTVSGDGVEYGKTVRMIMLRPGVDYDKLISGETDIWSSCVHIAQLTQTGTDGTYSFDGFVIDDGSEAGEYTAVINEGGSVSYITIDYASIPQILNFLTNANNAEEVKEYIEKYNEGGYELPIGDNSEYYKLDTEGQKYVLDGLRGKEYASRDDLLNTFNENVSKYMELYKETAVKAISGLDTSDDVLAALDKYEKVYGIDRENNELFSALDNEGKTSVYEKMTDETFTDAEQVKKAFDQKIILYNIQKGPWGKIPEYIEKYNGILGLDLKNYSDSNTGLLKYIVGKDCKDVSDLQELIDNYRSGGNGGGNTGGGGNSGGGSTGGSSGNIPDLGMGTITVPSQQPENANESEQVFKDVPASHWAYESINALYERRIINGKGDGIFAPDDFVTRAEAAKIIVSIINKDNVTGNASEFADVSSDSWAYEYINTASAAGIITGYDDGNFHADSNITRQDLCVMIYRAMRFNGHEFQSVELNFPDRDQISDYAYEAVSGLYSEHIVSGMDSGAFEPGQYATRAQLANIVYSILN